MSNVDRFFKKNPYFPESDFWLSFEISKFNFVPILQEDSLVALQLSEF